MDFKKEEKIRKEHHVKLDLRLKLQIIPIIIFRKI